MDEPVVVGGELEDVVVVDVPGVDVTEDPEELVDEVPLEELALGAAVPEELVIVDAGEVVDELPVVVVLVGEFATRPLWFNSVRTSCWTAAT